MKYWVVDFVFCCLCVDFEEEEEVEEDEEYEVGNGSDMIFLSCMGIGL